jgi:hypothetical protein
MRMLNGYGYFLSLKILNMRTLLKVTMDVVAANKALMDGSLPKMMQTTMETRGKLFYRYGWLPHLFYCI